MNRLNLRLFTLSVFCIALPVVAQEPGAPDVPPPPDARPAADLPDGADSPRTFIEESSPADLGATVIVGSSGRLIIHDLASGGLLATAGLQEGDTIISADGKFLVDVEGFHEHLASRPGQPVRLVVVRNGTEQTIVLEPVALSVRPVEIRPALGVRFVQGPQVILAEVVAGSPAELAGLRPGDHVVAFDGETLASTDHFITLVAAAPSDQALELTFVRNQERHWASIEPAAWDAVFSATLAHTALKPAAGAAVATVPALSCYTAPYIATNVSPVVVPAAWYVPYYSPYYYGHYWWAYPYYSVYSAYYPPAWYAPLWPYAVPGYYYAPRAPVVPEKTESASRSSASSGTGLARTGSR
jgi:membrane-associated protease RseP (regulator of RpoE activity)